MAYRPYFNGITPSILVLVNPFLAFAADSTQRDDVFQFQKQRIDALEQQRNRDELLRQQQKSDVSVHLTPEALGVKKATVEMQESRKGSAVCFTINHIGFVGDAAKEFKFALEPIYYGYGEEPLIGRCLGVKQINNVVSRAQNSIIERGYVTTRVLVPKQNLKTGHLQLQIIPGRVNNVISKTNDGRHQGFANTLMIKSGDVLNIRDLEQGLENLKRVPSVEADFKIKPSIENNTPGYSDIEVHWREKSRPYRVSFSVDDSGSRSTGKYQGNMTVSVDNLASLNDMLYVSYNHDLGGSLPGPRGSDGYNIGYSIPFGYWLINSNLSKYDYYQSPNETVEYSGESQNIGLTLTRMLYRTAISKTRADVGLWQKQTRNYVNNTEVRVQRRKTAGWQAALKHEQTLGNQVFVDAQLNFRKGTGALSALSAPESLFGEGLARAGIFSAGLNMVVPFALGSHPAQLSSKFKAQYARHTLTPPDRFSIGGRYTVRGFDGTRTLSGDRGYLIRNDLATPIGKSSQKAYLALDFGSVYMSNKAHERDPTKGNYLSAHQLMGAAFGIKGGVKGFHYDLFWGLPIDQPRSFGKDKSLTTGFSVSWSSP